METKKRAHCLAMMRLWVWSHLQICPDAPKIIIAGLASLPGTDSGAPTQVSHYIIPFRWQLSPGSFDLRYPREKGKTLIPCGGRYSLLSPPKGRGDLVKPVRVGFSVKYSVGWGAPFPFPLCSSLTLSQLSMNIFPRSYIKRSPTGLSPLDAAVNQGKEQMKARRALERRRGKPDPCRPCRPMLQLLTDFRSSWAV